jgi:regulator of protease activity HflC (stomatin/prohibitin superfamily)
MSLSLLAVAAVAFLGMWIAVPIFFWVLRSFGFYVIVPERRALVYTLFGKVVAVFDEPGMYSMWPRLGIRSLLVPLLGKRYVLDLRIDQTYLRSQPVNSEEGAPMGIGVWYETYISNPTDYLFKNQDPEGSMRANVSNATVRGLSNMKLSRLLEDRHELSQTVRDEVSDRSGEWGFKLGSVYIRKVHFRDGAMIRQIEEKVTNRLRQVTSAIKQDGANQVSVITSGAERTAAVEFARASAIRPEIVGNALQEIGKDPKISNALFEVLEVQRLLESPARITLLPPHSTQSLFGAQLAAQATRSPEPAPKRPS